jgi:hypothetical protein
VLLASLSPHIYREARECSRWPGIVPGIDPLRPEISGQSHHLADQPGHLGLQRDQTSLLFSTVR